MPLGGDITWEEDEEDEEEEAAEKKEWKTSPDILNKNNTYRTSFRSPLGSISELKPHCDKFPACRCVPRLFGVYKHR